MANSAPRNGGAVSSRDGEVLRAGRSRGTSAAKPFGSSTLRVRPRRSPPSEPACAACSMRATLSCLLVSFFPFPPSCISLLAQQPSRARSISEFRNLRGNGRQAGARPRARTARAALESRRADGPCKTSSRNQWGPFWTVNPNRRFIRRQTTLNLKRFFLRGKNLKMHLKRRAIVSEMG